MNDVTLQDVSQDLAMLSGKLSRLLRKQAVLESQINEIRCLMKELLK